MLLRIRKLICILSLLAGSPLLAHEESPSIGPDEGLNLQGTIATTYRSMARVQTNERWIIPGFLMGGEALPMPRGFALDEIFLSGSYAQNATYAFVKIGQHAGTDQASIEHALVGQRLASWAVVEVGRMNADFSPSNGLHPSQTPFADALLLYDAFWGRQYNDVGARTRLLFSDTGLGGGLEYWQGDAFPSKRKSDSDGAYDVYLSYQNAGDSHRLSLRAFSYLGRAAARKDDRYSTEHTHGVDTTTIPVFYFDGKTQVYGAHGFFEWRSGVLRSGVEGEYQIARSEGDLRDTSRFAPLESEYKGMWASIYQQYAEHQLSARYERLQFKNDLTGAGALALTQAAMLSGSKDPYRISVSYQYQATESLKWRTEWQRDFSTLKKKDMGLLGLVWIQNALLDSHHAG